MAYHLRPPLGGAVNNNVSLYICVSYIFVIPIYHSNVCESINVRPRGADQYENFFFGSKIINNFDEFVKASDLIISNRKSSLLKDYQDKVYTRDVFGQD